MNSNPEEKPFRENMLFDIEDVSKGLSTTDKFGSFISTLEEGSPAITPALEHLDTIINTGSQLGQQAIRLNEAEEKLKRVKPSLNPLRQFRNGRILSEVRTSTNDTRDRQNQIGPERLLAAVSLAGIDTVVSALKRGRTLEETQQECQDFLTSVSGIIDNNTFFSKMKRDTDQPFTESEDYRTIDAQLEDIARQVDAYENGTPN
jgi:hypothetical protein